MKLNIKSVKKYIGKLRRILFIGRTGYPFIDAGIKQLYTEGWIHHIVRNALACFLTRGDLWLNWEEGLNMFLKYLLDADWSVCAGNWMWVSSSAFEQVFNCSSCLDPGTYGRRSDPWGEYVKKYIPELASYPVEFIYEPWKAPRAVQEKAGCVVGKDYPERIVIHDEVVSYNTNLMKKIQRELSDKCREVIKLIFGLKLLIVLVKNEYSHLPRLKLSFKNLF